MPRNRLCEAVQYDLAGMERGETSAPSPKRGAGFAALRGSPHFGFRFLEGLDGRNEAPKPGAGDCFSPSCLPYLLLFGFQGARSLDFGNPGFPRQGVVFYPPRFLGFAGSGPLQLRPSGLGDCESPEPASGLSHCFLVVFYPARWSCGITSKERNVSRTFRSGRGYRFAGLVTAGRSCIRRAWVVLPWPCCGCGCAPAGRRSRRQASRRG